MKLSFWGANKTVTGSCHLLESNGKRILLDCGMFQGKRQDSIDSNTKFQFEPETVNAVLLSHAHLDHCGRIPLLTRQRYKNAIYTTRATTDIATFVLMDSGKIQEQDAKFLSQNSNKNIRPLYTLDDAINSLKQFFPIDYERVKSVADSTFRVTFRDAGHILGSAFLEIQCTDESGINRKIIFSGDLGRKNRPILRSPETPSPADTLIMESTYGNRQHHNSKTFADDFCEIITSVVERGGKVIIPAFAVERAQEILFLLNQLWNENRLPKIPVFMDSPMAVNVTDVFLKNLSCLNDNVINTLIDDQDPFGFNSLQNVRTGRMSENIARSKSPCIILAASGMCEGGRVLTHLEAGISDPKNAIIFVGFQAEETLGQKISSGISPVRIRDKMYDVKAEVIMCNELSGHADSEELREFANKVNHEQTLKRIFLVHGEPDQMEPLATKLHEDMPQVQIFMPAFGEQFDI